MLHVALVGHVLRVRLLPIAEIWTLLVSFMQELTAELEEKQDVFRSLQDTAELLSLENHPAKQTVEVSGHTERPGRALRIGWQQIFSPGIRKLAVPPHSALMGSQG